MAYVVITLHASWPTAYNQGWHLSFTQVFPRVKRWLGKTGENWVNSLFFPLNRIVLRIV